MVLQHLLRIESTRVPLMDRVALAKKCSNDMITSSTTIKVLIIEMPLQHVAFVGKSIRMKELLRSTCVHTPALSDSLVTRVDLVVNGAVSLRSTWSDTRKVLA